MLQQYSKLFISLFLLLMSLAKLQASHFQGGNFRFETISGCTTKVYLDLYYDCGGSAFVFNPPVPNVNIWMDSVCNPFNVTLLSAWAKVDSQEITPICPSFGSNCADPLSPIQGTYEYTYSASYDLCQLHCPGQSIRFIYENCCLSGFIYNISAPSATGIFLEAGIEADSNLLNHSPVFNSTGTQVICASQGGTIDLSATDADGDSLWYRLVPCLDEWNTPVVYQAGFSNILPLGPGWVTQFDSINGSLSLIPLFAVQGNYQVCVEVHESRNGMDLGFSVLNFVVKVADCGLTTTSPPGFIGSQNYFNTQAPSPNSFKVYAGVAMSVDLLFGDLDLNDSLTISYDSTALPPGSIITSTGFNPLTATLNWTPSSSLVGQTYYFNIEVQTQDCPFPVISSQAFSIEVVPGGLSAVITDNICNDSIGAIDLTFLGTNPPYNYLWSNGATTEDVFNLPAGTYWVNITQPGGLFITDTFFVGDQDLIINTVVQEPNCDIPTGAIYANVIGGSSPYHYQWSNGANGSAIWNQAAGGYTVIVSDALGCVNQKTILLEEPDSCYISVSGTVYQDLNGNCLQDTSETGIAFAIVDISPGGATMTDSLGHYSFQLDTGQYQLSLASSSVLNPLCPPSGMHSLSFSSFTQDTTGVNFGVDFNAFQDLRVNLNAGISTPATIRYQTVSIYNEGSLPVSGTVETQYDSLETWGGQAVPMPIQHDPLTRTLTWQYDALIPGANHQYFFYTQIDTYAVLTDTLKNYASVLPLLGDSTPINNADTLCSPVFAAYDPNDKQVTPLGIPAPISGEEGYISSDQQMMRYRVRFQNTGNFPATYVQILDTVDGNLDALQFRPAGSSHPYRLDVKEDSILVFSFDNINLPDSASDPLGSQGFVSFLLPHRGTLIHGARIYNQAAIYFDFNPPIFTNQVQNIVYDFPHINFASSLLCQGDSLTLNLDARGTAPYQLSWNGQVQTGNLTDIKLQKRVDSSAWQYVSWVDALGFMDEDSVFVSVAQNSPQANFNPQAIGQQIDFVNTSLEAFIAHWDFGDGNTSQALNPVHVYDSAGSYQVQLIVQNGCGSDTLIRTINVFTTSLADDFKRSVKLQPNPFSEKAVIHFANPQGREYQLKIYTASGKLVHQQLSRDSYFNINREGLSAGLYFFQIQGEWEYAAKLMIK